MNNDLKILISGLLDKEQSEKDINKQLTRLSRRLDRLKINVQIDDNILKTMKQFSEQMKRIQGDALQLGKRMEEVMLPDGTKVKTTRFDNLEESMDNLIVKAKNAAKFSEQFSDETEKTKTATEKQADATKKLANELDNLGKKQQQVFKQDGKGNLTGITEKYRSGYIDTIVNADKDGNITSMRIVENLNKEDEATKKLIQSKDELRQKHKELIQTGQLSTKQSLKLQKMIETSSNQEGIKKATDEHKRLLNISKEQLKVEQAKINVAKKKDEEIQKDKEHNRVLQQKLDLYKKEQALKIQDLKHRYSGVIDNDALDAHLGKVNALGVSQDTPHIMRQTALGLRQIEMDAKKAGSQIGKARGHAISLSEAFSTAMVKFPIKTPSMSE